jgi:hypothetical protein
MLAMHVSHNCVRQGDDDGNVKLFNAPCVVEDAPSLTCVLCCADCRSRAVFRKVRIYTFCLDANALDRAWMTVAKTIVHALFTTHYFDTNLVAHLHCYSYEGHSSHVTGVQFLKNDSHVVSVGGLDEAVFQWE